MVKNKHKDSETMKHSCAHVLAQAVLEMFPEAKLGIGPAIENGFYYDFELPRTLIPEDLSILEKKIKKIIKQNASFKKEVVDRKKAIEFMKKIKQPYKIKLLEEMEIDKVTFYRNGKFIDLCSGAHLKSTGGIGAFKLTTIAGAYWKGNEKNKMLQRIYGVCFETQKKLNKYLEQKKEAEKRDHRILGQKLDLFIIDEEVGAGLPIWLPKGALLRYIIEQYLHAELDSQGYKWLVTPHIGHSKLWETSGHWNFYNDSMYPPLEAGQNLKDSQQKKKVEKKERYLLKPMNCPFHVKVYNNKINSYKNLPIYFAELGTVYRYERSGTLHGLTRVRGFTQDDAHIICMPNQITQEVTKLIKHGLKILKKFGFKDYTIYLSTKPDKYTGTLEKWKKATNTLKSVLSKLKLRYQTDTGGGVFYGPKIDIKIKDSLGREWQCTTIQFDFNLPQRFKMFYIDKNSKKQEPIMIHRALLGSMERFVGVLLEHYVGNLPLWLSPVQMVIIPVSNKFNSYAKKITQEILNENIRVELNNKDETLGKRISESEKQKIPYMLVVGEKEVKSKSVTVRKHDNKKLEKMSIKKFIERIKKEIETKK